MFVGLITLFLMNPFFDFEATLTQNSFFFITNEIIQFKKYFLIINLLYLFHSSNLSFYRSTNPFLILILLLYLLASFFILDAINIFLIFLCLELQTFSTYSLIANYKTRKLTISAGFMYILLNSILTLLFIFGILLIYYEFHTLNFFDLKNLFLHTDIHSTISYLSIFLILSSLLLKIAAVPFHFWLKDVYTTLPFSILGFLLLNNKFILIYIIIKCITLFQLLAPLTEMFHILFIFSGLSSIIGGAFLTYKQTTLKSYLICSSIPQTGFLLIGLIPVIGPDQLSNILTYLCHYLVILVILWNICEYFLEQKKRLDIEISELHKLIEFSPILALLFSLCLMSLAGVPPLLGFVFKLQLLMMLFKSLNLIVFIILLIGNILSIYYYLIILFQMYKEYKKNYCLEILISNIPQENIFLLAFIIGFFIIVSPLFYTFFYLIVKWICTITFFN
jgi:NADH:ubiquinone oxidoreductase subunit 2 (subunit N)